jgi:hypothetical protein
MALPEANIGITGPFGDARSIVTEARDVRDLGACLMQHHHAASKEQEHRSVCVIGRRQ